MESDVREEGRKQAWRQGDREVAMNLGSNLVTTAETEAVKVSLAAKRIERTEQIKSNLGDKISMNNQCKG